MRTPDRNPRQAAGAEAGFSLVETMVSMVILLIVSAAAMDGMLTFTKTQSTVNNRATMHGGVRSATELLQQEVGQAGRISLPAAVRLTGSVVGPGIQTVGVSSTANMFVGEHLVIDTGATEETVTVTAVGSSQIAGNFLYTHAVNAPVTVQGGFATGVVPTTITNGSTGTVLKLYGDINGDGTMVYVEYTCDTANGNLYRNMMPFNAAAKPAVTSSDVLLDNVLPNPGGTACFTYQEKTVGNNTYVIDVAISLTTETEFRDKVTGTFQQETKALLNVSPRNVFDAWLLASIGANNRIQPMPPSVTSLLH